MTTPTNLDELRAEATHHEEFCGQLCSCALAERVPSLIEELDEARKGIADERDLTTRRRGSPVRDLFAALLFHIRTFRACRYLMPQHKHFNGLCTLNPVERYLALNDRSTYRLYYMFRLANPTTTEGK